MSAANIFNNTILIPSHDGLTGSGHDVDETLIKNNRQIVEKRLETGAVLTEDKFSVTISSDNVSANGTYCQEIRGLSITREPQKMRSGGEALYEVVLPGMISYSEVTLFNVYSNSTAFLNWLFNGARQGGAMLADVSISVGDKENGYIVYTLRDAFPIKWELGNLSVISPDEVTRILQTSVYAGEFPLEQVTIVYGKLEYESSSTKK